MSVFRGYPILRRSAHFVRFLHPGWFCRARFLRPEWFCGMRLASIPTLSGHPGRFYQGWMTFRIERWRCSPRAPTLSEGCCSFPPRFLRRLYFSTLNFQPPSWVLSPSPSPFIRACFAVAVYPVLESSRPANLQSPRYLCAACTCGQAISTAPVGEDGGCPAPTMQAEGKFEPFREELEGEEFECIEKRDGALV